jgi:hypothetical protein
VACTKAPSGSYIGRFQQMKYEFRFQADGTVQQIDMINSGMIFKGTWETYAGEVVAKINANDSDKVYTSYFRWSDDGKSLLLNRFFLTSEETGSGKHFLKEPAVFTKR